MTDFIDRLIVVDRKIAEAMHRAARETVDSYLTDRVDKVAQDWVEGRREPKGERA